MRVRCIAMIGALVFAIAPTGCATVIGLDSGHPASDDGGDSEGGASTNEASSGSDGSALVCAPETADCNGNAQDGCETKLGTAQHCTTCTDDCGPGRDCSGGACCGSPNSPCTKDGDCCSGQCGGDRCGKPNGG